MRIFQVSVQLLSRVWLFATLWAAARQASLSITKALSWLFPSGGQSIGASASASVLPMDIQDWYPLGWTGLILLKISAYTGTWCVIVVASQISEEFFSKTDLLYWEKWVASYLMPFTTINSR